MGLGRFRDRVNIYEIQRGQPDGLGGYATTKVSAGEYWAMVDEGDGTRGLEGSRTTNHSPYEITVRSGTYKVTTNNILEWSGIEMTISSVRYQDDKRWTIIQASANG